MRAHLDEDTTRLAAIWRITRKDGQQFFFTDHDRDIVFGGEVYRADAGFERTAIRSDAGFAVDNLDLIGVFAEGGLVEDEVRAGLFDGAEIANSFVNCEDPDGHGKILLRRGTLGETRLTPQATSTPSRGHRSHSVAFKRQVAEEYLAGETQHGLAKRHDISRNLIRVWVAKYEAGAFGDDAKAADLLQAYEARIAALERLVGKQALELEFLKGAARSAPLPRSAFTSVITGPAASPSPKDAG
jgi:transposase